MGLVVVSVITGLVVIVMVTWPFFVGAGGLLSMGLSVNSPDQLEGMRQAILKRYLEDEKAVADGNLSATAWQKRKMFLTNRFIDATRRKDFLKHQSAEAK